MILSENLTEPRDQIYLCRCRVHEEEEEEEKNICNKLVELLKERKSNGRRHNQQKRHIIDLLTLDTIKMPFLQFQLNFSKRIK